MNWFDLTDSAKAVHIYQAVLLLIFAVTFGQ